MGVGPADASVHLPSGDDESDVSWTELDDAWCCIAWSVNLSLVE